MYSAINIVNKGHITITFHYLHVFKVLTSNNSFHGYPGPSSLTKRDPFSEHAHFGSFHILPSVVTLCLVYPPTWKAGNLGKAKSRSYSPWFPATESLARGLPTMGSQKCVEGKCVHNGRGGVGNLASGPGALVRKSCVRAYVLPSRDTSFVEAVRPR